MKKVYRQTDPNSGVFGAFTVFRCSRLETRRRHQIQNAHILTGMNAFDYVVSGLF